MPQAPWCWNSCAEAARPKFIRLSQGRPSPADSAEAGRRPSAALLGPGQRGTLCHWLLQVGALQSSNRVGDCQDERRASQGRLLCWIAAGEACAGVLQSRSLLFLHAWRVHRDLTGLFMMSDLR